MKQRITITFKTDREITKSEIADLVAAISAQVEEPWTEADDPTNIYGYAEADYATSDIEVAVIPNAS